MGMCYKCKNFFGPDHLAVSENEKYLECHFCRAGKNTVTYMKESKKITVTKQECINKYAEFMSRMVKAEEIRKKVLSDQIKGK